MSRANGSVGLADRGGSRGSADWHLRSNIGPMDRMDEAFEQRKRMHEGRNFDFEMFSIGRRWKEGRADDDGKVSIVWLVGWKFGIGTRRPGTPGGFKIEVGIRSGTRNWCRFVAVTESVIASFIAITT